VKRPPGAKRRQETAAKTPKKAKNFAAKAKCERKQGLFRSLFSPSLFCVVCGTTKVVPFQNTTLTTSC